MKTISFAMVGLSSRGTALAEAAAQPEKGWQLVAGMDVSEAARRKFAEKFPQAKLYGDLDSLLADRSIQAVFLTSPDFLHEEQACAALEAKLAVYCEKPMAITIEGCDRMLETARRTGSRLFIGHNMRYYPVICKMKEIIDSGLIGEIQCGWCRHFVAYGGDAYFRDWHSERKNTTGLLLQKGAHDIDVMHFLMGGYTRRVVGMGQLSVYNRCARRDPGEPGEADFNGMRYPPLEQSGYSPVIDVEDHNMIMMQLDNGMQASYLQCHYTPDAERNYTFIGTRGRIENIGDDGQCELHVWTRRTSRQTPDIVYHLAPAEGTHGGSDPMILQNFFDFVMNGAKTSVTPVAARNAVATGVLGHQSMRNGNLPQEIPQLDPALIAYFENGQKK